MPGLEDFYSWEGPRPEVSAAGGRFRLPLCYHDDEFMSSLHTASYDAVAAELPSELIRPARWIDGRALVSVAAFRYRAIAHTDADGTTGLLTPYAELSVAALVTPGPAPRLLPVLSPRVSVFVLHLPVTTAEACHLGVVAWGFPKFVADMDFEERPTARRVTVSEQGRRVLTLTVRPRGPALPDHNPHVVYSERCGRLVRTVVPMSGYTQLRLGRGGARLELGDHPVGRRLARLAISPTPVALFNNLTHRTILPAGEVVGEARHYRGHPGEARALGRYTIRYPGGPPIDQYGDLPAARQPAAS